MLWMLALAIAALIALTILTVRAWRERVKTAQFLWFAALLGSVAAAVLAWGNVALQQQSTASYYEQPPRISGVIGLKKSNLGMEKQEEQLLTFLKEAYSSRLQYAVVALGAILAFIFTTQFKVPATHQRWMVAFRALFVPPIMVFLGLSVFYGARTANALVGALSRQYSPLTYAPVISNWALQEEFFLYGFVLALLFLLVNFVEVLRLDSTSRKEGTR